jgi:Trypsin-like peptidase domain
MQAKVPSLSRRDALIASLAASFAASIAKADEAKGPGGNSAAPDVDQPQPPTFPPLALPEQLAHVTTIIECFDGARSSTGTAFLFQFFSKGGLSLQYMATNRHVIQNNTTGVDFEAKTAFITLTVSKADGTPDYGNKARIEIVNFEHKWLRHPNPDIDLAIVYVGDMLMAQRTNGQPFFWLAMDQTSVPDDAEMNSLSAIEDIFIVGYPIGVYDKRNNVPVIRRGITATPPFLDFEGRPLFLIDAPIFHGSSGSPVIRFHQRAWTDEKTSRTSLGTIAELLGVVYGVYSERVPAMAPNNGSPPNHTSFVPIPTDLGGSSITEVPANLGIVIKAQEILEFEPLLVQQGAIPPAGYVIRADKKK